MEIKISVEDLVKEAKEWLKKSKYKRFIRIIPEKSFDSSMNHHPIERYLRAQGIATYYFDGDKVGQEDDYDIDLTKNNFFYLDEQDAKEILKQGADIYDMKGMSGFEFWANKYKGSVEEKNYLIRVCDYLVDCNSRANTRIFGIDSRVIENILENISL